MKLALKIDVDTYRGTREGVPRLIEILQRHGASATFLFSLGPDHTGRAIRRVFRQGFFGKVARTSVVDHYGIKTLLYGTLLPGPDIGNGCADILRRVRDAGFEVGIHAWDHVKWQDGIAKSNATWTARQMVLAYERFEKIWGEKPKVHGAAGWQMNRAAYRLTQKLGFDYCSDTRGRCPFVPVFEAEIITCPQLPTTLPTLDELIGINGVTTENVADHVLRLTSCSPKTDHVYTLHAELEGMKLAAVFEQLLAGWHAQGYELMNLRGYFNTLTRKTLPRCLLNTATIAGRSGTLAVQGADFLVA